MSQSASIALVVFAALVAANLPFLSQRLFLVRRLSRPKSLGWRLLELVVAYAVVGALGWGLEGHLGRRAPQGWEFFAITSALFLTLGFPGFVYRYLWRHRD